MNRDSIVRTLGCALLLVLVSSGFARAQNAPTLSFVNFSGENATVKLLGPHERICRGAERCDQNRCGSRWLLFDCYTVWSAG